MLTTKKRNTATRRSEKCQLTRRQGMMRMTDLNKYKFRSKTRQQNHHHQRKLQLQKIENQLIAFACGYKFINLLIDYGNPLTYDTIKRILKEQFGIFVLKYSSTPEARAAISKELTKLNEKEAIEKLHAILGINQIDDSNFMQFGDTPLAALPIVVDGYSHVVDFSGYLCIVIHC